MDEIVVLTGSKKLSCTFVLICLFITILLIPVPSKINLEPESNVQNLQKIKLEIPWATEILFFRVRRNTSVSAGAGQHIFGRRPRPRTLFGTQDSIENLAITILR